MENDKPFIITAEELFLFSLSRGLPYIPGVPDAINAMTNSEGLESTLNLAARVLASRGIAPTVVDQSQPISQNESLLILLCRPDLRVVVSIFDDSDSIVWDMVKGAGRALLHAWGRANEHLISEFDPTDFYEKLCDLAGLNKMDEVSEHSCETITVKEVSKFAEFDIETLSAKIKEWNESSDCLESESISLASALKGKSPTVLVTFNGSDSQNSRIALSSWMPSTSSTLWLVERSEDTTSNQGQVSLAHKDKSALAKVLKDNLEKVT